MSESKGNRSQRRNKKSQARQSCANQINNQVIKPLALKIAANSTILGSHAVWAYLDQEYMSAIRTADSCEERNKAINELLETLSSQQEPDVKLKEFLGHTPMQVCCGAVLGFAVAWILG